jgi:MoaA/NifB/PqqE/SkfB family radical SAM enzyme
MKLIYPDGTVVKTKVIPFDFTGIREENGSKIYYLNGKCNRGGGLPACEWRDGDSSYYVNGKRTGLFFIH